MMEWIQYLLEPFNYDYMFKAILVCGLVGGVCACLSCFVTLKGWSLMGDGLSHAVVPGVAIAYNLHWPYAIGAFVSGLSAAGLMGYLKSVTRIRQDAIIGVVYTAYFAAGMVLISLYPAGVQLKTIVFGTIMGIDNTDIWQMVIVSGLTLAIILLKWKDLFLYCFDPSHARTIGLNCTLMEMTLLMLMAATAIASIQTVGACLVMAMLITPGATAYLLTDRFGKMMIIASAMGTVTSAVGAYVSYYFDGSTGGCIVVLQTLIFLLVLMIAPRHGVIAGWLKGKSSAARLMRELEQKQHEDEHLEPREVTP